MLHHEYTTQSNDSLNKSVSVYTLKHKTYSLTQSLEVRVSIAGGTQIQGYWSVWRSFYRHFRLHLDASFESSMKKWTTVEKRKGRKQR